MGFTLFRRLMFASTSRPSLDRPRPDRPSAALEMAAIPWRFAALEPERCDALKALSLLDQIRAGQFSFQVFGRSHSLSSGFSSDVHFARGKFDKQIAPESAFE